MLVPETKVQLNEFDKRNYKLLNLIRVFFFRLFFGWGLGRDCLSLFSNELDGRKVRLWKGNDETFLHRLSAYFCLPKIVIGLHTILI